MMPEGDGEDAARCPPAGGGLPAPGLRALDAAVNRWKRAASQTCLFWAGVIVAGGSVFLRQAKIASTRARRYPSRRGRVRERCARPPRARRASSKDARVGVLDVIHGVLAVLPDGKLGGRTRPATGRN